jgi:transaldolase
MSEHEYRTPLHRMAGTTETVLWNDSCSIEELEYAMEKRVTGPSVD